MTTVLFYFTDVKIENLNTIETALSVTIPDGLKSLWLNYPLKAETGNSEFWVYDNADAIIKDEIY